MTTAAKFGAQDLTGNPFNYQQIVAPVSSTNVVVNTNFANRNGTDARVRLAATSVPLVSQTVSSTQGLLPYATTNSAASTTIPTTQTLTISNTTSGINVLTMASTTVSGTMVATNLITCYSTSTLTVGQPIVFSGALGNLVANVVYYVLTINSITTFTVSTTMGGIPQVLSSAAGNINFQQTTSNLRTNTPIVFTGTAFGGISTGVNYYVSTINSLTTFTVSTFPSGPAVSLFTAVGKLTVGFSYKQSTFNLSSTTAGTAVATLQALTVWSSTTGTNVFTTAGVAVTNTTTGTNLITAASTATLTVGQPVVFSGSLGNLIAGTNYYVISVQSTTQFTVSATWGGAVFLLSTAAGSITFQQSTANITLCQPIVFWGNSFGGVSTGTTYYVLTIPSTTTFTVSLVPMGVVFPLTTASGTMVVGSSQLPTTLSIASTAASVVTGAITVTSTATGTNLITTSSTSTLSIGQPVIFSSSLGGLLAGTTYYVLSIPGLTTFTVSANVGGLAFPLSTATGNITVSPEQSLNINSANSSTNDFSTALITVTNTTVTTNLITAASTAGLYAGMPVVFSSSFGGGIVNAQVYYVLTINSGTTFTISTAVTGPVVILSTASGTMYVQQSTAALAVNQPVTFFSGSPAQILSISNTTTSTNVLTTASIAVSATTFISNLIVAADTTSLSIGQPVVFSGSLGNLIAGTVYYVLTIPSTTQFTVSAALNNTVFTLATAAGSINVQQATTTLIVGTPIVFSGSTFGNIIAGTTYYIQSVVANTTFTVSASAGGSQFGLTTAGGTMFGKPTIPTYPIVISNTTTSTNVLTTASVAVTATTVTTNLITATSTATLFVGQAVVFSGSLGTLNSGIVYYVQTIPSTTQFTVSTSLTGVVFPMSTAAGSINVQQATTGLLINQPIVFSGTTFGNIIASSTIYYILTVNSVVTFTVSSTPGGAVFPLTTASGTMTTNPTYIGGISTGVTYYVVGTPTNTSFSVSATLGGLQNVIPATTYGYMKAIIAPAITTNNNVLTTATIAVTNTTIGTNLVTCTSTSTFSIGQPVVFNGSLGGVIAGTVYYILTIPSATTFTISAAAYGATLALSTAAGNISVQQSTAAIGINHPMVFSSAIPAITISTTTVSSNVLTTGTTAITNTTTGTNLITASSTSILTVGQAVVFSGTTFGNINSGTIYYIQSIPSGITFTISETLNGPVFNLLTASGTCNVQQATTLYATNQPIVFSGTTFGNIASGTTYYIQGISSATTFTVSTIINGPAVALTSASGSMVGGLSTIGGLVAGITYYVQSVPTLTSFSVSATVGGPSFQLTNFNGAMSASVILPFSTLTISNATVTTNVLTTASISITNTTTGTNLITATSTATLFVGQPVIFSGSLGNLVAGSVYYVQSIPSSTQFTVSTIATGTAYALSTAAGSITVQQSTINLNINQPLFFTGTAFGGLVTNTTYYVQSIVSGTTFTVTSSYNGSVFVLSTASGTLTAANGPNEQLIASNTTVTSNVITTQIFAVTNSVSGTNLFTCSSTFSLAVGMPVVFSATNGGVTSGTIYYIQSTPTAQTFSVSLLPYSTQVVLSTATFTMNVQQAVTNLTVNQPVVFSGTTFGNITAGITYYVQSIASSTTFAVSATPGGAQVTLTSASGLMTFALLSTNIVTINAISTTPIGVTGTEISTNLITCASTRTLAIGQPVVFSSNLGLLNAGTTYYILTIASPTTFTVSDTLNGTPLPMSSAAGSINVQQSTAKLSIGQPILFTSSILPITISNTTTSTNVITTASTTVTTTTAATGYITTASPATLVIGQPVVFSGSLGNLIGGTIYYVLQVLSTTQFTVSSVLNGTAVSLIDATGSINVQQSTTGWSINQPIQFSGTGFGNLVSGTTYYVSSIVSSTTFTVSSASGGSIFPLSTASGTMVGTFVAFGGLALNTIYYIQGIPSSTTFILSNIIGSNTTTSVNATTTILAPGNGALNGTMISPVPALTISNTTITTNVFTTATTVVSATTADSNLITCNSTANFVYGQPVVFSGSLGNLIGGTIYYVTQILSTTQFTVSTTYGGTLFLLTTAAGSINVQPATTNLVIGQPIIFRGAVFGNPVYGTTYYVNSIVSTTAFTVSTTQYYGYSGTPFTLATSSGTMTATYGPIQLPTVANTNSTPWLQMQSITVTSTSFFGSNLIGCSNTYILEIGMPVTFTGTTIGGLATNVVYYVASIPSSYTFTVSTVLGGPIVSLSYNTGSFTMYQAVTNLWLNQPIVFSSNIAGGVTFGGIVAGTTYYVQSFTSLYQFTISTLPGGSAYTLSTAASTSFAAPMTYTTMSLPVTVNNVYLGQVMPIAATNVTGNIITTGILYGPNSIPLTITGASSLTNILTCSSTAPLSIGLPITFSASIAGLFANTTYYVLNILSSTQFTVSNTWGGQQAIMNTLGIVAGSTTSLVISGTSNVVTDSLTTTTNTYNLYAGLPIVFSGSVFGNVVAGTTYYVLQVTGNTTFSISTSVGGSVFTLVNTTGTMTMTSAVQVQPIGVTISLSTANLTVGQPLIATGTTFGNLIANTTYFVNTIVSPTTFTVTVTQNSGTAFTLSSQFGYMYLTASNGLANQFGLQAAGSTGTATLIAGAPILFTGATIVVTNTNGTILTTAGNTGVLSINQQVEFTGYTIGGIVPNTTYYIRSIISYNTFTLSSTINGTVLSWGITSNQMTMQIVNNVGTTLQPYNAYYVQAVQSPFTFSISSVPGGAVTPLTTSVGTNIVQSNICTLASGGSTAYLGSNQPITFTGVGFGNIQTLPRTSLPFIVTNTTVTSNNVTVSNTATLVVGQPVIFMGTTWGNIVANTTYYILQIVSSTTFTISLTPNGTAVVLTTVAAAAATPVFYMMPSYYVRGILNSTQFLVSATPNGAIQPLITGIAVGGNVLQATGQPVNTDFLEFDSLIAANGVLERTGIIVPPNTYLYASSTISQVSALSIGIQEAV